MFMKTVSFEIALNSISATRLKRNHRRQPEIIPLQLHVLVFLHLAQINFERVPSVFFLHLAQINFDRVLIVIQHLFT